MKIVISIPFINCDFDGEEHYRDNCYFYSINKSDCRQESAMYNYHEKWRAPDLESVLVNFMTYQARSKDHQWESEW